MQFGFNRYDRHNDLILQAANKKESLQMREEDKKERAEIVAEQQKLTWRDKIYIADSVVRYGPYILVGGAALLKLMGVPVPDTVTAFVTK